jgi:hypothetical protein
MGSPSNTSSASSLNIATIEAKSPLRAPSL